METRVDLGYIYIVWYLVFTLDKGQGRF